MPRTRLRLWPRHSDALEGLMNKRHIIHINFRIASCNWPLFTIKQLYLSYFSILLCRSFLCDNFIPFWLTSKLKKRGIVNCNPLSVSFYMICCGIVAPEWKDWSQNGSFYFKINLSGMVLSYVCYLCTYFKIISCCRDLSKKKYFYFTSTCPIYMKFGMLRKLDTITTLCWCNQVLTWLLQ